MPSAVLLPAIPAEAARIVTPDRVIRGLRVRSSRCSNRLQERRDRLKVLAGIVSRAHERASNKHPKWGAGVIVIPAFAVGRVQSVLYDLRTLMSQKRIPEIPVFLDSPMAIKSTAV